MHRPCTGRPRAFLAPALALLTLAGIPGCVLKPDGTSEERARVDAAGLAYAKPYEQRSIPDLPPHPTWQLVLQRAFLANGDVEAAFERWAAAMERVTAAGAYPNANLSVGYSYMASGGDMRAIDRSTLSLGFDPAMSLVLPVKVRRAAEAALHEAQAAGAEFRVARFDLQKRVLFAWADYKAQAALTSIREQDATLRRLSLETARITAASTGASADLVDAEAALAMAENDQRMSEAELQSMRAMLNGLLARDADAPLGLPEHEEQIPDVPDDATSLHAAVESFPEVAVDVHRLEGRRDALALARLRWLPDISPTAMLTGTASQAIGAMLTLPTNAVQIGAAISESRAGVREAEATLRQKRSDRMGEYISLLILARDARRRADFASSTLVPSTERLAALRERAYGAGSGDLSEVLDSRRMTLQARTALIEAERSYEKSMIDIACCLGIGLDQVGSPTESPAAPLVHPEPTP
ncbi:MAG: TolC family protein [Phycisphaerales bacterium]